MYAQVNKSHENKSRAVANSVAQKKSNVKPGFGFVDNRPEAVAQRIPQEMAKNSPQVKQAAQSQSMATNKSPQFNGVMQRAKAITVTKDTSSEYSIKATGAPSTFTGGSNAGQRGIDNVKSYSAKFSADDQLNTLGNRTGRGKSEESNSMNNLLPEYVGGHLLPKEFGGSGDQENVFNQEGGQNSGSWRSFEIAASKVLEKTPPTNTFTYEMSLKGDNLTKA